MMSADNLISEKRGNVNPAEKSSQLFINGNTHYIMLRRLCAAVCLTVQFNMTGNNAVTQKEQSITKANNVS